MRQSNHLKAREVATCQPDPASVNQIQPVSTRSNQCQPDPVIVSQLEPFSIRPTGIIIRSVGLSVIMPTDAPEKNNNIAQEALATIEAGRERLCHEQLWKLSSDREKTLAKYVKVLEANERPGTSTQRRYDVIRNFVRDVIDPKEPGPLVICLISVPMATLLQCHRDLRFMLPRWWKSAEKPDELLTFVSSIYEQRLGASVPGKSSTTDDSSLLEPNLPETPSITGFIQHDVSRKRPTMSPSDDQEETRPGKRRHVQSPSSLRDDINIEDREEWALPDASTGKVYSMTAMQTIALLATENMQDQILLTVPVWDDKLPFITLRISHQAAKHIHKTSQRLI
ncbi:hypothetical protein ACJZ2D_017146 [Fusarium nematophilum]